MKLEAIKRNAEAELKHQKELADKGEEFSGAVIMECKRQIELIDMIVPKITDEEWERITQGTPGIDRDMSDCKDIKEKYGLSWNELKALRNSR